MEITTVVLNKNCSNKWDIIRHYSSTFKSARNDRIRTVSVQTTSRIIAGLVYFLKKPELQKQQMLTVMKSPNREGKLTKNRKMSGINRKNEFFGRVWKKKSGDYRQIIFYIC